MEGDENKNNGRIREDQGGAVREEEESDPDLLKNTPGNIRRLEDEIEQFEGRQKYLAQTSSPSDGGDVRWYFCKVPLAPHQLAASIPRAEVVGKGEYFRFGMRDSLAIEASFLQKEEELLSYWWKEYAECSEGPKVRISSSTKTNLQQDPQTSELYVVEEERVGVPVKGGLYEFAFEPPDLRVLIVGSCHGIICFKANAYYSHPSFILLCNPSMRDVVIVPAPKLSVDFKEWAVSFGFGFDPIADDYKVVKVGCRNCSISQPWQAVVYSLRNGCWRNEPFCAPSLGHIHYITDRLAILNANGRICNWLAYTNPGIGIISFDFVEEVLKEILVPDCVVGEPHYESSLLPSSRHQVCVCLSKERSCGPMDIWALPLGEEAPDMWIRILCIQFPQQVAGILPLPLLIDMGLL